MYKGIETNAGGAAAVDMAEVKFAGSDETFVSVDLTDLAPGTYEWIRVSLIYDNYVIDFYTNQVPLTDMNLSGRLESYVGFNNYITSHVIKDSKLVVNENKLQGWVVEWGGRTFRNVLRLSEQR